VFCCYISIVTEFYCFSELVETTAVAYVSAQVGQAFQVGQVQEVSQAPPVPRDPRAHPGALEGQGPLVPLASRVFPDQSDLPEPRVARDFPERQEQLVYQDPVDFQAVLGQQDGLDNQQELVHRETLAAPVNQDRLELQV